MCGPKPNLKNGDAELYEHPERYEPPLCERKPPQQIPCGQDIHEEDSTGTP